MLYSAAALAAARAAGRGSASISASVMWMRAYTSRSRTRSTSDLVAQVGAKARVVDAFAAQPLAQLRQRDLVLRRHVADGAVELGVVDAQAALARMGELHALVDQRVEHLLAQLVVGRQALAPLRAASARTRAMRCCTSPAVTSSWLTTATM